MDLLLEMKWAELVEINQLNPWTKVDVDMVKEFSHVRRELLEAFYFSPMTTFPYLVLNQYLERKEGPS